MIDFEQQNGVAMIRINRPAARNALSADMRIALTEAANRVQTTPEIRSRSSPARRATSVPVETSPRWTAGQRTASIACDARTP